MQTVSFPAGLAGLIIGYLSVELQFIIALNNGFVEFVIEFERSCGGNHAEENLVVRFYMNDDELECELGEINKLGELRLLKVYLRPDWISHLREQILNNWCRCRMIAFKTQLYAFVRRQISKLRYINLNLEMTELRFPN
jgi:hypothetical protein